jgi:protein SCO1/2
LLVALALALASGACRPQKPRSCDLTEKTCTVRVGGDDGVDLVVDVGEKPLGTGVPLLLTVTAPPRVKDLRVTLNEPTQMMTMTETALTPTPTGFSGSVTLAVCAAHRMDWLLDLAFTLDGTPRVEHFTFATFRNPRLELGNPLVKEIEDVKGAAPVDFALSSSSFRLSQHRGEVVLLVFGFASCPDICPTTLASLAAAQNALSPAEKAQTRVVFVSVDPARDTPAQLTQYAGHFGERIVGVTGTPAEIAAAALLFRVFYEVNGDVVDHASFTSVIDKEGRLVARVPHAAPPDVVHRAVRPLLTPSTPTTSTSTPTTTPSTSTPPSPAPTPGAAP